MSTNVSLGFRKKEYNSSTDNTSGVVTFDTTSKKIYLAGDSYGGDSLYVEKTYSQLAAMVSGGTLVKGQKYRITDYATTTAQTNTTSANHAFDLVVTATDTNKLDCMAQAVLHSGDTYFSTAGADLSKWQVWYDINNNTTKYAWAKSTANGGKGVIYRLIDEWGNDCPYDFKNILFTVSGKTANTYTFNVYSNSTSSDHSLNGRYCYGNVMKPYYVSGIQTLNFNVFYNTSNTSNCYSNTFGGDCSSNTFGDDCYSNTFGDFCQSNTFGDSCSSNTFGDDCYSNTFGDFCQSNTFGDYCSANTFGDDCSANTFGDACQYNTFGDACYYNTFGDDCSPNTFGDACQYNTFGDTCYYNILGNYCSSNTFGDTCNHIVFGNSSTPSVGGTYCRYNVIENGNQYIRLYQTTNEGSSNYLQNIYIAQGVNSTTTYVDISTIARNLSYRTTVAKLSDGTIRIYREDEDDMLPSITGNAGKVLTVNSGATGVEWTTITPGSTTLSGLTDTTITNPSGRQFLTYDSTTSKWINSSEILYATFTENNSVITCDMSIQDICSAVENGKTVKASVPIYLLGNLEHNATVIVGETSTDPKFVYFSYTIRRQSIGYVGTSIYDSTNQTWTDSWQYAYDSGSISLDDIEGVSLTSPTSGQVLTYNGSNWENAGVPTEIPTQTGNSGKFLTTNGTSVSWADTPTELPSLTNNAGKVLAVNSGATGVEWITNSGGGGSSTLAGLTDTNISSPSGGQTLKYNSSSSKWENSDFPTEIPPQSGNNGKFLTTSGSSVSWANIPTELPTISGNANKILAVNSGATGVEWTTITPGSTTLSGLTDTTITNPADKQVLTYDNTTSKWVNANAEKEIFWCVMTETNGVWSCDKTSSEIYAAYQAGKLVCLENDNSIYSLAFILWDSSEDDLVATFTMDAFVNKSVISGGQQTGTAYMGAGFYYQNGTWSYDGTMLNNIDVLELIPDSLGTAGQVLTVNSGATGLEFAAVPTEIPSQSGNSGKFLTTNGTSVSWSDISHDIAHDSNQSVSSPVTVTFAANQRGSKMITVSANVNVTLAVNNLSDNYLWVKNSGSSAIDVTIAAISNSTLGTITSMYLPTDGISVEGGKVCEIGIVVNADGAFITCRNDLELTTLS